MVFSYPALFHLISEGPDEGGYFIEFPDLPCCMTQVHDPADAKDYAIDVLSGWLRVGFRHGHPFNHPSDPATLNIEDGFVEMVTSEEIDVEAAIAEGMACAARKAKSAAV